jgi:4-hydroxybenzoate polyprenyltransferase
VRDIPATIRAWAWWDHKLAPLAGTGYATVYMAHGSLLGTAPRLLLVLLAVAAAAAYVSLINDLCDLRDDRAAGKANRLAGRSRRFAVTSMLVCAAIGAGAGAGAWETEPAAWALFAGPWIAFTLYSASPVRLKNRGAWGTLADAAGAHLFPQLLMAVVVLRVHDSAPEAAWLAAVAVWSLALGLRGAVWHQLEDRDNDRVARVRTFGAASPGAARRLVERGVFPLELAAFGVLLALAQSVLAIAFLLLQVVLERVRSRIWDWRLAVVASSASRLVLHEYYVVFYPLAFLAACAVRQPDAAVLLVAHCLLFHRSVFGAAREFTGLAEYQVQTRYLIPRRHARAARPSAATQNPVVTSAEPQRTSPSRPS